MVSQLKTLNFRFPALFLLLVEKRFVHIRAKVSSGIKHILCLFYLTGQSPRLFKPSSILNFAKLQ